MVSVPTSFMLVVKSRKEFDLPDWKCEGLANSIVLIFFNLQNVVPLRRTEDINSCIAGKPPQLFSITRNDDRDTISKQMD